MSDEKILKDIKGLFEWMKIIKKEEEAAKKKNQKNQLNLIEDLDDEKKTYNQLKEFLNLLKVDASQEEIEALDELANPEGGDEISFESNFKKNKNHFLIYLDFYKVFVKSEDELMRENFDLKEAFKLLSDSIREF